MNETTFNSVVTKLRRLGIVKLTLGGGEPLLHPHLIRLIELAKQYEFIVQLDSNLSVTRPDLNMIFDKIDLALTSLPGVDEIYNKITGGNFENVINNIYLLKKHGLITKLNIQLLINNIILEHYKYDIIMIFNDFIKKFIKITNKLSLAYASSTTSSETSPSVISFLVSQLIYEYFRRRYKLSPYRWVQGQKSCGALSNLLAIDVHGNVYPCPFAIGLPQLQITNIGEIEDLKNLSNIISKRDEVKSFINLKLFSERYPLFPESCPYLNYIQDKFNINIPLLRTRYEFERIVERMKTYGLYIKLKANVTRRSQKICFWSIASSSIKMKCIKYYDENNDIISKFILELVNNKYLELADVFTSLSLTQNGIRYIYIMLNLINTLLLDKFVDINIKESIKT